MSSIYLPHRTIISIQGEDIFTFLQGLTTNNILAVTPTQCVYTAFLNPQGKFLNDAFVTLFEENHLWLDVESKYAETLLKKLNMYKLRSNITLTLLPDIFVYARFGAKLDHDASSSLITAIDPRSPNMGERIYSKEKPTCDISLLSDYDHHRIKLCIPDGTRDIPYERGFIMEYGMDTLNAIDFNKGCYIGQELTARMHYRNLGKRQLVCFEFIGNAPAINSEIMQNDTVVGTTRTCSNSLVLAHVKKEAFENNVAFFANNTELTLHSTALGALLTNHF